METSEQIGEMHFLFIPSFKEFTYRSDRRIFTLDVSTDADSRNGMSFWLRLILHPI